MANLLGRWGGGSQTAAKTEVYDDGSIVVSDGPTTSTLTLARLALLISGAFNANSATNLGDRLVTATLALGSSGAGVANKALALTLKRADGSTAITSARDVIIRCAAESSPYDQGTTPVATVTFGTATVGSIVASGNGWALVRTSAAGAFACTCTDSADETIEFWVETPVVSTDAAKAAIVLPNVPVSATWA